MLVQLVWLGIYNAIMLDEWKLYLIILIKVGICLKDFQNSRVSYITIVGVLELGEEAWVNLDDRYWICQFNTGVEIQASCWYAR